MKDFVAIDFETANYLRSSVCSVGIVVVRDGKIVEEIYKKIYPRPCFFTYYTTAVHGLTIEDVKDEKEFPQVWKEIESKIKGLPLVAHNSPFDEGCLRAVFKEYNMPYPEYKFYCTCRASRQKLGNILPNHQLHTVSKYCGYNLKNHHHALADAEACAAIALKLL